MLRRLNTFFSLFAVFLLGGSLSMPLVAEASDITAAVRADLASTGKLRVGVNYQNFILAAKDPTTNKPKGVAIDVAEEIARRLGVPAELVVYDTVPAMVDAASTHAWDIAFCGSAPQREATMSFTQAYLEIEASYLVPGSSPLKAVDDVDRAGVRIATQDRANYELFLTRTLKHAALVRMQDPMDAFDLLAAGKVDALAGLSQSLYDFAQKLPGSHVLEGRFMAVQQSIAVPKGRDAGLAYLRYIVEEIKKSGLVARGLERLGARGVSVAPPLK
jgi:polar amino acid transport system substrate-binding protein